MRTKTYQQLSDQICRLARECKRDNRRRNAIARIGKRYIHNAFAYVMHQSPTDISIDELHIPASVYAKQV